MTSLEKYILKFQKLRRDKNAPHKPILLISVIQGFQNNLITSEKIYITPELVSIFNTNWSLLVTSKNDCRFALPFTHLSGDKFWQLIPKIGYENIVNIKSSLRSFINLNLAVEYAIIDIDLFELLIKKEESNILLNLLLDTYFPESKINFNNSNNNPLKGIDEIENQILNEPSISYKKIMQDLIANKSEEEIYIRGGVFKREIPKIYNYTCCISEMRIVSKLDISMVDACHIKPFSISYDDTICNGIPLSPNLHRAFDRGLIAIDENYKVVISKVFTENKSNFSLNQFADKKILLPENSSYYPDNNNFSWHMKNVFKK